MREVEGASAFLFDCSLSPSSWAWCALFSYPPGIRASSFLLSFLLHHGDRSILFSLSPFSEGKRNRTRFGCISSSSASASWRMHRGSTRFRLGQRWSSAAAANGDQRLLRNGEQDQRALPDETFFLSAYCTRVYSFPHSVRLHTIVGDFRSTTGHAVERYLWWHFHLSTMGNKHTTLISQALASSHIEGQP